jgi:hypothetical protein
MEREREREGVVVEEEMVKIERRRRARVVLPDEEGPERPMRRVLVVEGDDGCEEVIMVDNIQWREKLCPLLSRRWCVSLVSVMGLITYEVENDRTMT